MTDTAEYTPLPLQPSLALSQHYIEGDSPFHFGAAASQGSVFRTENWMIEVRRVIPNFQSAEAVMDIRLGGDICMLFLRRVTFWYHMYVLADWIPPQTFTTQVGGGGYQHSRISRMLQDV